MINLFQQLFDESGLKQKFLAEKTGTSTSTISAIYKGQIPHLETALKIAKVMGKRVDEIWCLELPVDDLTKMLDLDGAIDSYFKKG